MSVDPVEPDPIPAAAAPADDADLPRVRTRRLRRWRRPALYGLVVLLVAALVYYPVGMVVVHKIDDDPAFAPAAVPEGGSRAVALAAALIGREVDQHGWTANDPFFLPGAMLDNMPNYQQGIIAALARFAFELTDQIGRSRGSSQADPDLQEAAGQLQLPGNKWVWDPSTSLAFTATSEQQYRKAMRALLKYNQRLAAGQATFERRADNLLATLDRIAADLGSASAALEERVEQHSGDIIDFRADDLFYNTKGRLYAYALLMRELGVDFDKVLADKDLGKVWQQTVDNLMLAAQLQPWWVVNGAPDSQFSPSHLASQGFFLLRARTQLREVSNILLK
ncbi:MAG: DUF2333 family protein [Dongiaceae bacterium]